MKLISTRPGLIRLSKVRRTFRTPMTDVFNKTQRSAIMRRVRSVNTSPELCVRQLVHQIGLRFRLHDKNLPGKPDLVFARRKQVLFVHGCYWHQHHCKASRRPASNTEYWNAKLDKNIKRDRKNARLLRQQGWRVLTIWECQLRDTAKLENRLTKFFKIGGI